MAAVISLICLIQFGEDIGFAEELVFFSFVLKFHFRSAVFGKEHLVSNGNCWFDMFSHLIPKSWAYSNHDSLENLGLRLFRDDDSTGGLGQSLGFLDEYSVQQGNKTLDS